MTSPAAKTIQIYLPTGEPRGIRIAEITTRIVQAILIPRSELAQGKARKEVVASAEAYVVPRRKKLVEAGVMDEHDDEYVFNQDYLFPSPSNAAAVVLGRTANGWLEWKDKAGRTLSEVYRDTDESEQQLDQSPD